MDPLETRLSNTNANRLRCNTDAPSTVIWARFEDDDYGIKPPGGIPMRFQARLTNTNGGVTMLPAVNARMQHYQRKFYVTGWAVPGTLETHRGSLIRIESTNGTEAVTFACALTGLTRRCSEPGFCAWGFALEFFVFIHSFVAVGEVGR